MLNRTKNIDLTTHDLDMLTVLLRRELHNTIKLLKTAPIDQDTSDAEALADHIFDLMKRLEAAREDLSREIFTASAWVNGIEDTYKTMLDID